MNDVSQYKFKSQYVYNFIKYIEWPDNYKQGNFVIGISGSNQDLFDFFKSNLEVRKTVYNQAIEVKSINSASEAAGCSLVYILSDNSNQLPEIVSKLKGKSTLILAEKEGMAKQGVCLNFVYVSQSGSDLGKKLSFEYNMAAIDKYKLKISDQLLKIGIEIK
jgi:YfiR/HmsC-like